MNNRHQDNTTHLQIWQQNLNASKDAQIPLLNGLNADNWDILTLQEPYIKPVNNTIST
ncbi:hypothetical protein PAXRUDRAFT_174591 [Paxillus rubicundulus Ve08.2h10]|uniref:Endonuclease/exonuclease/phosphatase domain-containing protein n=1 Tax=Paxillus rubicundulus Ve08.2h10 TaxID=930991 RepID=A0A0D0CHX9_9AGAM|nr:hypothetical protein PAXRUDRAFT_174591 [Paxillus rubicundulus Ve08.2h10]